MPTKNSSNNESLEVNVVISQKKNQFCLQMVLLKEKVNENSVNLQFGICKICGNLQAAA